MRRKASPIGVSCAVLALLVMPLRAAGAEEATEAFNALYGEDLARVRETADARDDVDLAARLLAAARKATDQPPFLTVLCEKACDLAVGHPTGYGTALAAMDLLARTVPERGADCAARTLEIRQQQFDAARGDEKKATGELLLGSLLPVIEAKEKAGALAEAAALYREAKTIAAASQSPRAAEIEARAAALAQRMKTAARVADVKALLARDPANVSAREGLVRIYLVDLDDPAEAAKYLKGVKDKSLLKYVPAAAKGVEAPPELACMELGEWYRGLGGKAAPGAQAAMYARAKAYYERFLSLHTPEDLQRTQATLALKEIQAAFEKSGGPPPAKSVRGRWIDLLPLVDPAKDAVKGDWKRQGSALAIISPTAAGCIAVPIAPQGSYELQVNFVRTSGDDLVAVFLPVGSARVTLVMSHGHGRSSGLTRINGKGIEDNQTTATPGTLVNGRQYALHITVVAKGDQARIAVRLDGKPYINWRGPQSALSVHSDWHLREPGCLGLGAWQAPVVFRSVRLKMLSGEARLLRPKEKPTPAAAGETVRPGRWIDLLPLVDPAKDAVKGNWKRQADALAILRPTKDGRIMIPVAPEGSYELQVKFVRTSRERDVIAILPVGSARVVLALSHAHGHESGLKMINGKGPQDNKTAVRPGTLVNGREYALHVTVLPKGEQARIDVRLDGKPHIAWRGPPSALSLPSNWALPRSGCLGLGAYESLVVFRSVRLKMLSGQARSLRPAAG